MLRDGPRWFRIGWKVALGVVVVLALYVGGTFFQVWQASRRDQAQEAGAIVVMGAAQYNGESTPNFGPNTAFLSELKLLRSR